MTEPRPFRAAPGRRRLCLRHGDAADHHRARAGVPREPGRRAARRSACARFAAIPGREGDMKLSLNAEVAPSVASSALEYASLGWPVFPCHPATRSPLQSGKNRPLRRLAKVFPVKQRRDLS